MYNRIIENFRKRLNPQIPVPQVQQQLQPQIHDQPQEAEVPQEIEQEHQSVEPSSNEEEQSEEEILTNSDNEQFFQFAIEQNDPFLVFENDEIKVYIEKKIHQRHKRFQLQDFLYNVKISVKENVQKPLLKDLLQVLEKILSFILKHLRTYFRPEDHNVVYIDLFQSPMINALNSGGFLLQDQSNEVVERLLGILNQFLISDNNLNLEINDTFKMYINVFSVDHVNYTKKSTKNPQPNRRKKHYGCNDKIYNFPWAIDIPKSYQYHENIFQNKCFLLCIILGILQNAYFKSNRNDTRYLYAQGINYNSKKKQNYAGNILRNELEKVISNLSLDENGPYDFVETATKISNFYDCQIFIFGGFENSSKLKCIIPNEINDQLMPIYLYEPFDNENHVLFIKNLNSYFSANRRFCMECKKSFKSPKYKHRCIQKITCFACRRKFCKPTTYLHEKLKENYCDTKINTFEKSLLCKICNCFLKTKHCKKGHQKICNGKGQFGFKCLTCKKFTYRRNNDNSESLKQAHQCGFLRCKFCGCFYDENENEKIHVCPLTKENCPKVWPTLCFLRFAFQQNLSDNCAACYEKKLLHLKANNLTLKEVLKNESPDCICENHQYKNNNLEPSLLILYKEHNVQRGLFNRHVFSKLFSNKNEDNVLRFDYTNGMKIPSAFVKRQNKFTEDINTIIRTLNYIKNEELTIPQQLLKTIFCDKSGQWQNTTFILQDEDSQSLVKFVDSKKVCKLRIHKSYYV